MEMKELIDKVEIILSAFSVSFRKSTILRGTSTQLAVEDFGVVVCCINRVDYTEVASVINREFPNWRSVFVTPHDDLSKTRYEILWALMRSGYMRWLRSVYPRQVKNVLNGPDNLGYLIIQERLRAWNDKPKYRFLIEDNKFVLKNGILSEFSIDPGFFDYMPEIN